MNSIGYIQNIMSELADRENVQLEKFSRLFNSEATMDIFNLMGYEKFSYEVAIRRTSQYWGISEIATRVLLKKNLKELVAAGALLKISGSPTAIKGSYRRASGSIGDEILIYLRVLDFYPGPSFGFKFEQIVLHFIENHSFNDDENSRNVITKWLKMLEVSDAVVKNGKFYKRKWAAAHKKNLKILL